MNKYKNVVISKKMALRHFMEYLGFDEFVFRCHGESCAYNMEKDMMFYPERRGVKQNVPMDDELYDITTNQLYKEVEARILAQEAEAERKRIEKKVLIVTGILKTDS